MSCLFNLKQCASKSSFYSILYRLLCSFTLFLIFHTAAYADTKRFFSKKGHLSVQPPLFFNKPKIHREQQDGDVLVAMIDDVGTLFRIEQLSLDPSIQKLPKHVLLTMCLDNLTVTIKQVIPDVKILDQEILELNNKNLAQLCLFDFPKGSVLMNMGKQERFSSMRGCIFFIEENKCIILSYQTDLTFTDTNVFPPDVKEVYKRYRTNLLDAANSFRIEK